MANHLLNEFLREKKAKATPADVDWTGKRDAWIDAVEKLYDTIENNYLATAKDAAKVDRGRIKIVTEPYIGDYSIAEMTLAVGDDVIGIGAGTFGSYATTAASLVTPRPRMLSVTQSISSRFETGSVLANRTVLPASARCIDTAHTTEAFPTPPISMKNGKRFGKRPGKDMVP